MQKPGILFMLMPSVLGLFSCASREHVVHAGGANGFSQVFEGFVHVGADVNREAHNSDGMDMPLKIAADHYYIFHHAAPFDEAEFARTVLPQRLEKLGFSLIKPVDAGQGFVAVGPIHMWSVNFAREGCSGSLGNRVCLDLTKRRLLRNSHWAPFDYVLALHGSCDVGGAN